MAIARSHSIRQRATLSPTLGSEIGMSLIRNSIALLRRYHVDGVAHADVIDIGLVRILVDTFFDLVTEMRDQALDRPGGSVAERADGVAFDLLGDLQQHVD